VNDLNPSYKLSIIPTEILIMGNNNSSIRKSVSLKPSAFEPSSDSRATSNGDEPILHNSEQDNSLNPNIITEEINMKKQYEQSEESNAALQWGTPPDDHTMHSLDISILTDSNFKSNSIMENEIHQENAHEIQQLIKKGSSLKHLFDAVDDDPSLDHPSLTTIIDTNHEENHLSNHDMTFADVHLHEIHTMIENETRKSSPELFNIRNTIKLSRRNSFFREHRLISFIIYIRLLPHVHNIFCERKQRICSSMNKIQELEVLKLKINIDDDDSDDDIDHSIGTCCSNDRYIELVPSLQYIRYIFDRYVRYLSLI
jgi:hypothetical protein